MLGTTCETSLKSLKILPAFIIRYPRPLPGLLLPPVRLMKEMVQTASDGSSCHLVQGAGGGVSVCGSQFSTSSWNHFLCELNREESADKGTILGEPSSTAKSYFLGSQWLAPPPPVWKWLPWWPRAGTPGAQNEGSAGGWRGLGRTAARKAI